MSFLVVYLTEALGWSLVAAGLALTVRDVGGVAGRIVWGAVADRILPPRARARLTRPRRWRVQPRDRRLRTPAGRSAGLLASRALRRDGDRLERRPALRGRAPRAAGSRRRGDRRVRLHHVRGRRRRAARSSLSLAGADRQLSRRASSPFGADERSGRADAAHAALAAHKWKRIIAVGSSRAAAQRASGRVNTQAAPAR